MVPSVPPETVKVTLPPGHIVVAELEMFVGAEDKSLTEIVIFTQAVVLQLPSALTKYVVVVDGLTVMVDPDPTALPPQAVVYHSQEAFAPRFPPETLSKQMSPGQMLFKEGIIAVAAVDVSKVVIETLTQFVVLQVPSALM